MSEKGEIVTEQKEEKGKTVEELQSELNGLQSELNGLATRYNSVALLLVNAYSMMVEIGHNSVQTGSALQEFTQKNKNTYATLVSEIVQKQQKQQK